MKEIRMGVIGLGAMGSAHAENIARGMVEGMILQAVCDIDCKRRKWAQLHFPEVYIFDDASRLLTSGKVDAVIIATPHSSHPLIATEAFRRGIHVLSEKPAGIDICTVKKENEAAAKSGVVFGIMFNQRTNSLFGSLREYMHNGTLGELIRFQWVITNWYRTQAYYDSGSWRATWKGEGGGVLMNQCPHNLDIWQWITGMPNKIRADCKTSIYHDIEVEDSVNIFAEYDNGATATFIASTCEYPGTNRLELTGTKGRAVIEKGKLTIDLLDENIMTITKESLEPMPQAAIHTIEVYQKEKESGHIGILNDFSKAVRTGSKLLAPGTDGILGLSIANAAYLSDWTGETVALPLDEKKYLEELRKHQKSEAYKNPLQLMQNTNGEYEKRWNVKW